MLLKNFLEFLLHLFPKFFRYFCISQTKKIFFTDLDKMPCRNICRDASWFCSTDFADTADNLAFPRGKAMICDCYFTVNQSARKIFEEASFTLAEASCKIMPDIGDKGIHLYPTIFSSVLKESRKATGGLGGKHGGRQSPPVGVGNRALPPEATPLDILQVKFSARIGNLALS